jgi:hypothetical protein
VLTGPISGGQSAAPPSGGCFSLAHQVDTKAMMGLPPLVPGNYTVSLTVTRNGQSNTSAANFTV